MRAHDASEVGACASEQETCIIRCDMMTLESACDPMWTAYYTSPCCD